MFISNNAKYNHVLNLSNTDWHSKFVLPDYHFATIENPDIVAFDEVCQFREGFRLVRRKITAQHPVWNDPFETLDYVGFCFTFCPIDTKNLALGFLCHDKMNITNGYGFDGGIDFAANKPMDYVALQFSKTYLRSFVDGQDVPVWLTQLLNSSGIVDSIAVPLRLRELAWQLCQLPPATNLQQRLYLESLALQWLGKVISVHDDKIKACAFNVDDVIDIIHAEHDQTLTINSLAQRVGTNACYLKQAFKEKTGKSVGVFITEHRLQHAADLLKNRPDLSIQRIASMSGYDAKYFSSLFKKHFHASPQAWRKKNS